MRFKRKMRRDSMPPAIREPFLGELVLKIQGQQAYLSYGEGFLHSPSPGIFEAVEAELLYSLFRGSTALLENRFPASPRDGCEAWLQDGAEKGLYKGLCFYPAEKKEDFSYTWIPHVTKNMSMSFFLMTNEWLYADAMRLYALPAGLPSEGSACLSAKKDCRFFVSAGGDEEGFCIEWKQEEIFSDILSRLRQVAEEYDLELRILE